LWADAGSRVRLKFITGSPTSGNRDHGSFTESGGGVPCVRGLNVRPATIDREQLLRIDQADHERHAATKLRAGDIVVVRSGLAGSAAVVPPDLDDSNCVDVVIIRKSPRVSPRYLEYVVNSREAREQVGRRSVGALLTHFNAVDAADLEVPDRSIADQEAISAALDAARCRQSQLVSSLSEQLRLLDERRQALISATVTGQIEVPVAV
jgi:type I restriction enzyme, S subunit